MGWARWQVELEPWEGEGEVTGSRGGTQRLENMEGSGWGQRGTVACKQGGGLVGGKQRKGRGQGKWKKAEGRGTRNRCQRKSMRNAQQQRGISLCRAIEKGQRHRGLAKALSWWWDAKERPGRVWEGQ